MIDVGRYRVQPGAEMRLRDHDPDAKHGFEAGKAEGKAELRRLTPRLSELQRKLWADSSRALLVVLQAMDTGGKDGTIRHVFRGVNPQGVKVWSFGVPTEWELVHDYLWRVHERTPPKGSITIFNRSHYEDVLVVRVRELVPETTWSRRYEHIRSFEKMLFDEGTIIVKLFLHISQEEQAERLQARLDDPDKRWKFSLGDLDERKLWQSYERAYEAAIGETSADHAPWYIVPANRKWYRNLVVSEILIETLEDLASSYPEPDEGLDGIVVT